MFFGLRHPTVICRHHEQREIDRAHAGDHVLHEILVSRHVDNTDVVAFSRLVRRWQLKMRETKLNRNAT